MTRDHTGTREATGTPDHLHHTVLTDWVTHTRPARMRTRKITYTPEHRDYLLDRAAQALLTAGWPLHQGLSAHKFFNVDTTWGWPFALGDRAYHSLLTRYVCLVERGTGLYRLWDWDNPTTPVDTGDLDPHIAHYQRVIHPLLTDQQLTGHRILLWWNKPTILHWQPGNYWTQWAVSEHPPGHLHVSPFINDAQGLHDWLLDPPSHRGGRHLLPRLEHPDHPATNGHTRLRITSIEDLIGILNIDFQYLNPTWQPVPDTVPRGLLDTMRWALTQPQPGPPSD